MRKISLLTVLCLIMLYSCDLAKKHEIIKINTEQGTSLLNKPLTKRQVDPVKDSLQMVNYLYAKMNYEEDNNSADNIIWLGRRMAYLGDYKKAIEIFTEGMNKFPEDARFLRHRGHRYISTRQLDKAIEDLEKASELIKGTEDAIEPDGVPNKFNTPVSSLHNNIYYHLGLAYYLKNDLENALRVFQTCLEASKNNDMVISTVHWLYMINRRMDMIEESFALLEPITKDMEVIENFAYHDLLLFYKGEKTEKELMKVVNGSAGANEATQYGIANWHYYNGNIEKAKEMFQNLLENGNWAGFGYASAEADLSRME